MSRSNRHILQIVHNIEHGAAKSVENMELKVS